MHICSPLFKNVLNIIRTGKQKKIGGGGLQVQNHECYNWKTKRGWRGLQVQNHDFFFKQLTVCDKILIHRKLIIIITLMVPEKINTLYLLLNMFYFKAIIWPLCVNKASSIDDMVQKSWWQNVKYLLIGLRLHNLT